MKDKPSPLTLPESLLQGIKEDWPMLAVVGLLGGVTFLKVFIGLIGCVLLLGGAVYAVCAVLAQAKRDHDPDASTSGHIGYLVTGIGSLVSLYYVAQLLTE